MHQTTTMPKVIARAIWISPKLVQMDIEQRLQIATEFAAREVQILSDPTSKLYPMVKKRIDSLLKIKPDLKSKVSQNNTVLSQELQNAEFDSRYEQENSEPNISTFSPIRTFKFQGNNSRDQPSISNINPPQFSEITEPFKNRKSRFRSSKPTKKDFQVPSTHSLGQTRTGLKFENHRFLTEFEKMRMESDDRLQRAIRNERLKKAFILIRKNR